MLLLEKLTPSQRSNFELARYFLNSFLANDNGHVELLKQESSDITSDVCCENYHRQICTLSDHYYIKEQQDVPARLRKFGSASIPFEWKSSNSQQRHLDCVFMLEVAIIQRRCLHSEPDFD